MSAADQRTELENLLFDTSREILETSDFEKETAYLRVSDWEIEDCELLEDWQFENGQCVAQVRWSAVADDPDDFDEDVCDVKGAAGQATMIVTADGRVIYEDVSVSD